MKISGSFNNNVLNAVSLSLLTLFLQQQTESTSTSMLTLLAADSSTNNLQQFSVSLARTQCVPQRHFRTSKQTHLHPQFYTEFHLKETHTHTHPFNGPFSRTTQVSRYQKGKSNLDFTEARDSEWQWHQLGHMQSCTLLQTENHASTPPLCFLQAGCPSCCSTNSVKALKAIFHLKVNMYEMQACLV